MSLTFDAKDSQTSSPIAEIEWDLGDGTIDDRLTLNHVYQAAGTYVVTLKLTDQNGLEGVSQKQVQIEPAVSTNPPIAKIEAPSTAGIEENIIFDGEASQGDNSLVSFCPSNPLDPVTRIFIGCYFFLSGYLYPYSFSIFFLLFPSGARKCWQYCL